MGTRATDIAAWLRGLGLERYAPMLNDAEVTVEALPELAEADLEKLGLPLGPRKLLLKAIAGLQRDGAFAATDRRAAAAAATAPRKAERRQLTVMFVDLVGSTALSARLDPEEMGEVLKAYQNAVTGAVARFEGHVAKLMGDGVLAYFGWPTAHEDEAERAIRAGLSVGAAVARLEGGGEALACRVGIATGLVVVGELVGVGAAQEEAVVGDTPNLAARLQGLAAPGQVVIADVTRRLVGDLFALQPLGRQALKGLPAPVLAYVVSSERALESRFAARRGIELTPIVGRDQELALLIERWRQAKDGEGQLVLLTGEAGIGKSRIIEALVEAVAAEPHFLLRYQCSPYHADSALYPVIQQIAHAAGFAVDDSAEHRLDKLAALLNRVGEAAQLLAGLMGLDGSDRYGVVNLTPRQRRSRTLTTLIEQLGDLAARRPVLWVVEDAHWIDPTTLELIELALDRVQASRVLMLVTARPTFVAGFASHPTVTRLALDRLARAAILAIVTRVTGGKRFPELLLDEIAARADGVPLFVEEMTKAVLESHELRETADAWHLDGPLSALAIPTSLNDSLMARLDRLQPVKEVAQTAAVIGRSFDHRTIAALSPLSEAELAAAMSRLVEAELVFRRGVPPDATYLFKHALVRDAAYESLLKAARQTLHARLLDVLEGQAGAAPELKAQHAEAAGLAVRALDLWEEAGAQALARPAYQEAIASLEKAIRLCRNLGHDPRRRHREVGLELQLGQALIANRGHQALETLHTFERALEHADAIGDVSLQLPAVFGQWSSRYIAGKEIGELGHRFAALAKTQPESGPRMVGLRMLGLERFHAGCFSESLALVRQSLVGHDPAAHRDLAHQFGHDPRTAAANYEAWNLWHLGFPDRAARTTDDNLRWTRQVNHANSMGFALCFGVALVNIWLRRPDRVESAAREALGLAEHMSLALWHAWALTQFGWALSQQHPGAGLEEIEAGISEAQRIGAGRLDALHFCLAADAYLRVGRSAQARESIKGALAALARTQTHDIAFAAEVYRSRAALVSTIDSAASLRVEADLQQSLAIARRQASPTLELRAARDLARLWAERGERRRAHDLLAPVCGWFTEGFDTPDFVEAQALLEKLA